MDPVPPKKPKDLPFYEAPDHVQTSAKIISDAKNALVRANLRCIQTKRPVTPQDSQRKLFGEQSIRDPQTRPPSAFSLGARNFDSESRPVSGTRLLPLDHKPKTSDPENVLAPKPPADPNRPLSGSRRASSRQRASLQHSNSVDSSPPPSTTREHISRTQSLHDGEGPTEASVSPPDGPWNLLHSESRERKKALPEARGEGDGSEFLSPPETQRHSKKDRSKKRDSLSETEVIESSRTRESSAGSQRASSAGKSGSAGRREVETPEEALYYNTHILPILENMAGQVKEKDTESLISLSEQLYKALEEGQLLGKACKQRSTILKTMFKMLDLESPQLLLKLATLILALKVSGNNLINVCKLVFKVCREEKHDKYFMEGNIIELLLETVDSTDFTAFDALVYCIGSLKFLSGNSTTLKFMVKKNALKHLSKLLCAINKYNIEVGKTSEQLGHVLVQLTATLRNMADVSGLRVHFLQLGLIDELCKVMDMYSTDADLMLNISRIFSKLTMHTDCCNVITASASHFKSFIHLLKIYQRREDLTVRLAFILGNLTSKSENARRYLMNQSKALDVILSVFKHYLDLDAKDPTETKADEPSKTKIEDVLVKLVRLIANLSISDDIGPVIASNDHCVSLALQILESKDIEASEELVMNTVATLNNLSFYNIKGSAITTSQLSIAKSLLKLLNIKHLDGLAEAARVFGNLSRDKAVRDFMIVHKVDEMMVLLLDSQQQEVVFAACGVLINLMADEEKRPTLKRLAGIQKLVEVLRDFARRDWHLGAMVCQTLWNYSTKITSCNACFGETQTQELVDLLTEYLEEETALDAQLTPNYDAEMQDYIQHVWQTEFCPAASDLLRRIEAHQSSFESL